MAASTKQELAALSYQIAALAAQVAVIGTAVQHIPLHDRQAEEISTLFLPASGDELQAKLGSDMSKPVWGKFFDEVAEVGTNAPFIAPLAELGLSSTRASVRAAAARALAVTDDVTAKATLPAIIERESNVVAKAIMRAALGDLIS